MIVSIIVAMDENNCIGYQGKLPWRLRADLQRFKSITMGHHLIMGRKTYASIGKALPGRVNVILTRQAKFHAPGCVVVDDIAKALEVARQAGEQEAFVIGGGEVFAQALPWTDRIYLTRVHARLPCSVFFPELDWTEWECIGETITPADADNQYDVTYGVWIRHRRLLGGSLLNEKRG